MRILNLFLFTLGRILVSIFFIGIAIKKMIFFSSAQGALMDVYALWVRFIQGSDTLLDWLFNASGIFLWLSIGIEVIFGTLLLLGNNIKMTTMILGVYLFLSTCFLYPFWLMTGPGCDIAALMFIRHGAIAGGLLSLTTQYAPSLKMRADFPLDESM